MILEPPGEGVDDAAIATDPVVDYHSPISVAVGSSLRVGRAQFYVTAEWFDAVDRYRVMSAPEIPADGVGSSLDALLTQELKSVLNAGLGAQFAPRDDITLFGSVITDYSSATDDPRTGHSFATWDIYQFTGGAAFSALRADFTLGLSYGGGSNRIDRLNDVDDSLLLPGSTIQYERWKFFLGFEFRASGPTTPESGG